MSKDLRMPNGFQDGRADRPMAQIVIQWNPNNGQLNIVPTNLNPVEEQGLLAIVAHTRMNMNGFGLEVPRVQPVASLPAGMGKA